MAVISGKSVAPKSNQQFLPSAKSFTYIFPPKISWLLCWNAKFIGQSQKSYIIHRGTEHVGTKVNYACTLNILMSVYTSFEHDLRKRELKWVI